MEDHSASPARFGHRAAQYWFIDGLPDVVFGSALMAWGLVGLVGTIFFPGPWMKALLSVAGLCFLVLFWKDRKILDAIKSRVTYPRTGYVKPPGDPTTIPENRLMSLGQEAAAPPPDENVTFFRLRTVLVLWLASPFVGMSESRWSVPIAMTAVAFLLWVLNRKIERPYGFWAVLPLPLAGLAALLPDLPVRSLQLVPLVIGGAWLLLRGGWTLLQFLRRSPYPRAAEGIRT